DSLPATIPDNKQIIPRPDRPTQTGIDADVLRVSIVLNEASQNEIETPCISGLHLPQLLNEVAFRHVGEVVLRIEGELHTPFGRGPFYVVLLLSQVAVVKLAEPGRRAEL